ncbi:MAG: TetR/AcrR family transcriptional regulator [Oceanicaulis sp.]
MRAKGQGRRERLSAMDMNLTKRARQKIATRIAVIEAARRVFATKGYDAATIAAIAKAAKVSPGTVLNAASTKIALLNEVMRADFEQLGADCEGLASSLSAAGPKEAVAALLEQHLARHAENLDLMRAAIGHCWTAEGDHFSALYANLDIAWRPVRRILETAERDGRLNGMDARELTQFLQDAYLGVLRRCVAERMDLFAASSLMRVRLDLVLGAALKV